jgi:hypothetical protein
MRTMAFEVRLLLDAHREHEVTWRPAAQAMMAQPVEADVLAVEYAGRDLHDGDLGLGAQSGRLAGFTARPCSPAFATAVRAGDGNAERTPPEDLATGAFARRTDDGLSHLHTPASAARLTGREAAYLYRRSAAFLGVGEAAGDGGMDVAAPLRARATGMVAETAEQLRKSARGAGSLVRRRIADEVELVGERLALAIVALTLAGIGEHVVRESDAFKCRVSARITRVDTGMVAAAQSAICRFDRFNVRIRRDAEYRVVISGQHVRSPGRRSW